MRMKYSQKHLNGVMLVIIGILVCCNIYSLIPLYQAISSEMQILENQVAIGSMLFTVFYAFGLLFFGSISVSFGNRHIITVGLLLSAISTVLISFASEPLFLYIFRSLQGFTLASFAPVAFAYVFEIFGEKERTLWISLINAGFLAAGIIGQVSSSIILHMSSWQFVFIVFSCLYFLFFILASIFLLKTNFTRTKISMKETLNQYLSLIRNDTLSLCYVIVFSILFSFVGFYEVLSYELSSSFTNSIVFRAIGLIGVILCLFTNVFIQKYTEWKTLEKSILLGWVSIFFLFFSENHFLTAVLSIFFVASISLMIPTIIHIIGIISGQERSRAISLYSFILLIGASFGSFIAAILPKEAVFLIMLCLFTINFYAILSLKNKASKEVNEKE